MANSAFILNGAGAPTPIRLVDNLDGTWSISTSGGASQASKPTSGALTNRSGTIAAGGTAQTAAALNAARIYLYVENPIGATETLWFSTDATATVGSPSIGLAAGQAWENPAHFCPTGALSVIGATISHAYTVKEA